MNKKVIGLIILVMFFLALTVNGAENETKWEVFVSKDEMTGKEVGYAISPSVTSSRKMENEVSAKLIVAYNGEFEMAFISFSDIPLLQGTSIGDEWDEIIHTRIKWDDEVEPVTLLHEWDSPAFLFKEDEEIVSKIINSDTMMLELNWYGEGNVYFQFPLEGADEAIDEIHKKIPKDEAKWRVYVSKDEMTGEEVWYAISPTVTSTQKMEHEVLACLIVGYNGEIELVNIWFSLIPNLQNSLINDGYDIIRTRIKWDDEVEPVTLLHEWGSYALIFAGDEKDYVSKIINSDTMMLELNWYGEGKVYFQFPLEGAAEAIDEIHNNFSE
ncbi:MULTISPECIES: hypothetical protein [unclassified Petrotoga]|uniref:hypothetical protein n=1 Tax=unclassified Petrotoga TaxID=2620614 RepID=UPI000CA06DAE|nr:MULTISPECIES: hypothetical protein [unclassified Petrotoga]PNR93279.1 hypothetical protein X926_03775 [Petrotoga sp. HWHPT.55.6.3]